MKHQQIIEQLIARGLFSQPDFGIESLEDQGIGDQMKDSVVHEMEALKEYCVTISDRMRTMNNTNLDHFIKLLNKRYIFTDPVVYRNLYNYGMFWSR